MTTRKRASKGEVLPLTFEQRTIRRLLKLEERRVELDLAHAQLEHLAVEMERHDAEQETRRRHDVSEAFNRFVASLVPLVPLVIALVTPKTPPTPAPSPTATTNGVNGARPYSRPVQE